MFNGAPFPFLMCPGLDNKLHSHSVICTLSCTTTKKDWMGLNLMGTTGAEEAPVSDGRKEHRPGGRMGPRVEQLLIIPRVFFTLV